MEKNRRCLGRLALHGTHHAFGMVQSIIMMVQGQDEADMAAQENSTDSVKNIHPSVKTNNTFHFSKRHTIFKYRIFPQKKQSCIDSFGNCGATVFVLPPGLLFRFAGRRLIHYGAAFDGICYFSIRQPAKPVIFLTVGEP